MRSFPAKITAAVACMSLTVSLSAVTVQTWKEDEPGAFDKGKCERTVTSSLGRIMLGRAPTTLLEADQGADFVNALCQAADGTVYAATGPNGKVYRIEKDKATLLCTIKDESNLFSLLVAADGGLLVGTGGSVGRIYKVTRTGESTLWFDPGRTVPTPLPEDKPDDKDEKKAAKKTDVAAKSAATKPVGPATTTSMRTTTTTTSAPTTGPATTPAKHPTINYIWAMARTKDKIYAATGATGLLLEIDADGRNSRVIFDSKETNLLSLAICKKGQLHTGSDKKGLIYRVDPADRRAFVLYDAAEAEVSAICLDAEGNVYAATAAAAAARPGKTAKPKPSGRPDTTKLSAKGKRASAPRRTVGKIVPSSGPPKGGAPPKGKEGGNAVYRIAPDGMVTEVFREPVMILDMVEAAGSLYLSTGNEGRVYEVRPEAEEQLSLAKLEDKHVTAILRTKDGRIYLGTSNEGRVVRLSAGYAVKGTFTSQVLDGKQICRWGRARWEGKLPKGTDVTLATRSGNADDPEDGMWESWSKELDARDGAQIPSTSARFLQYRLTLATKDPTQTPRVRLIELARQSNNIAPKVTAVEVGGVLRSRLTKSGTQSSGGPSPRALPPGTTPATRVVKWKAEDANGDRLVYDVYLRTVDRERWIRLKKDNKTTELKWDTSKVPDGRYEIRVEAKDAPSNPPQTSLTDDRISDMLTVDNTAPSVGPVTSKTLAKDRVRINAVLADKHSALDSAHYAVDSHEAWVAILAEDDLFDSPRETVSFELDDLEPGEHVITLRTRDAEDNTGYATIVVTMGK